MPTQIQNDSTGTFIGEWLDCVLPRLDELVTAHRSTHGNVAVSEYQIPIHAEDAIAWRCAVAIAASRLSFWPSYFFEWFLALTGAASADPLRQERMRIVLCKNLGTPESMATDAHLCGLVGEALLGSFLSTKDRGLGTPVLFEGHDWSVTDHGGDCLVLMEHHGCLRFQLWECKSIYGATATGTVIRKAAEQLHAHAAEYLARFATVAARDNLPVGAADFLLCLQDLWIDDDPRKFAGISVSTHASGCTEGSFGQIENILALPGGRSHGAYTSSVNFLAFANQVRELIWQGCGLR